MSWRRAWRTTARPKSHYSAPERARFGVWLCVPTTLFRVLEVGHTRIGSLVHVPDDTSDAQPASRVGPDVAANVFLEAHKRNNQLVCALLRHLETVSSDDPTCWNGDFVGALDHVFASRGFPVASVACDVPELKGSIPDAEHGSDHVPVRVQITLRIALCFKVKKENRKSCIFYCT